MYIVSNSMMCLKQVLLYLQTNTRNIQYIYYLFIYLFLECGTLNVLEGWWRKNGTALYSSRGYN